MTFIFLLHTKGRVKTNLGKFIMIRCARDHGRCCFSQRIRFVVSLSNCPVKCFQSVVAEGVLVTAGAPYYSVQYVYCDVPFGVLYNFTARMMPQKF